MMRAIKYPAKKASVRNERGTAAIEFGLLIPLLAALLLSGAEIGFFIQQTMVVNSAVAVGVAVASKNGFDAKEITSAILNDAEVPGMAVTPAPKLFCGCAVKNSVAEIRCDGQCAGNIAPGHYLTVGARLKPQTIMPGGTLPLPSLIAVQSTTRLN
jgi:Flp pilus assembly pilin Flp